jgi:hypothetical protein
VGGAHFRSTIRFDHTDTLHISKCTRILLYWLPRFEVPCLNAIVTCTAYSACTFALGARYARTALQPILSDWPYYQYTNFEQLSTIVPIRCTVCTLYQHCTLLITYFSNKCKQHCDIGYEGLHLLNFSHLQRKNGYKIHSPFYQGILFQKNCIQPTTPHSNDFGHRQKCGK